jgi:hypothetical protein
MTQRIYFDNAATTPMDPLVVQEMLPYLSSHFGNPSSIYSYGRENRLKNLEKQLPLSSMRNLQKYFSPAVARRAAIQQSSMQSGH